MMANKIFTSKGVWDNGLFFVRIFTALMIFQHGKELFDNKQMNELINFMADQKLPFALAYLAKITELAGSILIAIGLFTRYITPPLIISMAGVIYTMSGGNIFNGDLAFLYLLLFLSFFFIGPGKWSLDYVLFDEKHSNSD
jgi:putative oxidoreductase